jgi:hypothetical protein
VKYIIGITIVVAAITAGWKMFEPEFTNVLFQDDLRDTAAQLGWRTGLSPPNSDEDLRNIVIRKAASHDIRLAPEQVLVRHSGTYHLVHCGRLHGAGESARVFVYRVFQCNQRGQQVLIGLAPSRRSRVMDPNLVGFVFARKFRNK